AGTRRIGPGLAEAGDRAIDQPRVLVLHAVVGEAVLVERRGLEILDQHVALPDQLANQLAPSGLGEIDRDRALVAIAGEEIGALPRRLTGRVLEKRRREGARV